MYIYDRKMTKVLDQIKTRVSCLTKFSEIRSIYERVLKNMAQPDEPHTL
jgi:hypothetical protein